MNVEELKINVTPVHGNVLEFEFSTDVFAGKLYQCHESSEAAGSSFLKSLYELGELGQVSIMPARMRLQFTGEGQWQDYARKVGKHVRSWLSENPELDIPEAPAREAGDDDGEIQAIKNILRTQVGPALGAHGGNVEVIKYEEGKLYLRFGGGCQGCSQISQTVKGGVEALLKRSIPSIREVIDVTDHSAGENPYFD